MRCPEYFPGSKEAERVIRGDPLRALAKSPRFGGAFALYAFETQALHLNVAQLRPAGVVTDLSASTCGDGVKSFASAVQTARHAAVSPADPVTNPRGFHGQTVPGSLAYKRPLRWAPLPSCCGHEWPPGPQIIRRTGPPVPDCPAPRLSPTFRVLQARVSTAHGR